MDGRTYLLFVTKPTGYDLREREGDPPPVGSRIEDEDGVLWISKIGPSPLQGDPRSDAYSQQAQ